MDFSARLGADPPPHSLCGKGLQRRVAEKDAVLCFDIYDSRYWCIDCAFSVHTHRQKV